MNKWSRSIMESVWHPDFVRVKDNLYLITYAFMKVLTASQLIAQAEEIGLLSADTLVVESTSGNLGMGLAQVCAVRKQPLHLLCPPSLDVYHRRRMEALGARVEIVDVLPGDGGQAERIARIDQIATTHGPNVFAANQYMRPSNRTAYGPLAAETVQRIPRVDTLVGTVGSGGSMCGMERYLRPVFPLMHTIGIDVHNSVLFGCPDGPRYLTGAGASLVPEGLKHIAFDEVHWLCAADAAVAGLDLARATGLFQGPTSGMAWKVASWHAERHPDRVTVAILPDEGQRYLDTFYDDEWRSLHGLNEPSAAADPVVVTNPVQVNAPQWTRIAWNRRTLEAAMSGLGTLPP